MVVTCAPLPLLPRRTCGAHLAVIAHPPAVFSEAVTGTLASSSIEASHGSTARIERFNDTVFTFDIVDASDGQVSVSLAANAVTDLEGSPNLASQELTFDYGTGVAVTPGAYMSLTA